MSNIDPTPAAASAAKAGIAWGTIGIGRVLDLLGIHSWADYSYMVAGVLSTLMVLDWVWKKWKARQ
jgi:hypothetical protein